MINHYAVLGILPSASDEEIKASYRQLAKRFHPDTRFGNSQQFARIHAAYEALSTPQKRKQFDEEWETKTAGLMAAAKARQAQQEALRKEDKSANAPVPMLTRIMSIAVPRSGRFQMKGLVGNITIHPTTPDNLWVTTLKKFHDQDPERLSRHVIQIKLSGERDLVKGMMPRPTDFGVEFQKESEAEQKNRLRQFFGNLFSKGYGMYGSHLPLNLEITVPKGVALNLQEITGNLVVGDMEAELVTKLLGGSLQAGRLTGANLTLNGASKAYLPLVEGAVDLMGFGESRAVIDGNISQMRVVLENSARAEVRGPVDTLAAEVNETALLEIRNTVNKAQCDVRGNAYLRIDKVTSSLKGTRSKSARVHAKVLKKPVQSVN